MHVCQPSCQDARPSPFFPSRMHVLVDFMFTESMGSISSYHEFFLVFKLIESIFEQDLCQHQVKTRSIPVLVSFVEVLVVIHFCMPACCYLQPQRSPLGISVVQSTVFSSIAIKISSVSNAYCRCHFRSTCLCFWFAFTQPLVEFSCHLQVILVSQLHTSRLPAQRSTS